MIQPEHGGIRWWSQGRAFSALALFQAGTTSISRGGQANYVAAADVTPHFFAVFAATPLLGRDFRPGEFSEAGKTVIISYGLCRISAPIPRFWGRRSG